MAQRTAVNGTTGTGLDPFPGRPALPQLGMMMFLASDLMLFAGFFAANFVLRARSTEWPPAGVSLDLRWSTVFTLVLVSSSVTFVVGMRGFERTGDPRVLRRWTLFTMALGFAFLLNQLREYVALEFSVSSHAYGSVYWMITGLHAAHVFTGLLLLSVILIRSRYPTFDRRDLPAEETIGYFWHFVDGVWVAVYLTIFVLQ